MSKNPHFFLGEELLIPNADKLDGGRTNMVTNHLNQFLTVNNSEKPKVFTRFENQIGIHSSAYKFINKGNKILKTFKLNKNNMYIIFEDINTKVINLIHYTSTINLTESYGYESNLMATFKDNEIVDEDALVYRNNMFDDELNLQMGVNLKTVFLSKEGKTFEDSIIISDEASEKLTHTDIHEIVVVLNTNDILINWNGDKDNYIPFPSIGDTVKDGILCVRRRIDYNTILEDFKLNNFYTINPNDQCFYVDGVVEDITVYSNMTEKEEQYKFNDPIVTIDKHQAKIYKDIYKYLSDLKNKKRVFTDDVNHLLQYSKDFLNNELRFSYENTEFEGCMIKFTIANRKPVCIGSKLTGRFGNKGVVSKIVPKAEMPVTEDGKYRADICLNILGVYGRLNPAQLYEQELNYFASEIVDRYRDNHKHLYDNLMIFFKIVSEDQYIFINSKYKESKNKSKFIEDFALDILDNGVFIHQYPFFENITTDKMLELHTTFNFTKKKFVNIHDELIIGDMYFIKLKHEAQSKMSIRSSGPISLLNIPYKNNDAYKKGNTPFSNAAIKFGEQETINLLLLNNEKKVVNFLKNYSSSETLRKKMITTLFRSDINSIQSFTDDEDSEIPSNAAETVRALFKGMGIEFDKNENGEFDVKVSNDFDPDAVE